MFYKKGLSPLIATMLLIAFAVSIGVVIITVLNTLVTPDVCSSVMLVKSTHYIPVCYYSKGGSNVKFFNFNLNYNNTRGSANDKIVNLTINFYGKTSSMTKTVPPEKDPTLKLPASITPGMPITIKNIAFDTSIHGDLKDNDAIEIIPIVKGIGSQQLYTCNLQKYVIMGNQIPKCPS